MPLIHIALLRGINVSGQNRVPMSELKALAGTLGYTDVRTYLQSGNLVFQAPKSSDLAATLRTAIHRHFGHDISVLVLDSTKLNKIADQNPFLTKPGVDETFLHVTFLDEAPKQKLDLADLPVTGDEAAILAHGQIYLSCPHGYGRTKLTNIYFERRFKVAATTRNWRTVRALQALAAGGRG